VNNNNYFARAYIVNLLERTDRRRQMEAMLRRIGLDALPGWLTFFPAVRPESPGGFPSCGARGCFLSHLEILRQAQAQKLENVLIMEDDLEIDVRFKTHMNAFAKTLGSMDWTLVYFGHLLELASQTSDVVLQPTNLPIQLTHFYAVNGPHIATLVRFLEAILERPPGHPDGGPMHVDGAYITFRQRHPELLTLVANPSVGWQRSSRSDVTSRWFDKAPVLREIAGLARQLAGAMGSLRRSRAPGDRDGRH
jgi:hypothetical protein